VVGVSGLFLVAAAFLAGVVSFSSPCCLPLLPGYVAYVSGDASAQPRAGQTMTAAALFTVGFGVTFTALGASASWLGAALLASRPGLVRGAGVLVVAVGVLTVAGVEPRVLARERRPLALHRVGRGPAFGAARLMSRYRRLLGRVGGTLLAAMGVAMAAGWWTQVFAPLVRWFARSGWPPI
jgi:cytochrome c-type biogenesis protein